MLLNIYLFNKIISYFIWTLIYPKIREIYNHKYNNLETINYNKIQMIKLIFWIWNHKLRANKVDENRATEEKIAVRRICNIYLYKSQLPIAWNIMIWCN